MGHLPIMGSYLLCLVAVSGLKGSDCDAHRYATFSAIYLLSGIAGSTASFLFNDLVTVGASGAIFGLLGECALQHAGVHRARCACATCHVGLISLLLSVPA